MSKRSMSSAVSLTAFRVGFLWVPREEADQAAFAASEEADNVS